MANDPFKKLFDEDDANELIPRLELLVQRAQLQVHSLRKRISEIAKVDDSILGLELSDIIERHPELSSYTESIAAAAGAIEELGCVLKDLDTGLIDFPAQLGDEVVFLCWQSGEPKVIAWHSIDGGFAGRQPIPGTSKPYLN